MTKFRVRLTFKTERNNPWPKEQLRESIKDNVITALNEYLNVENLHIILEDM